MMYCESCIEAAREESSSIGFDDLSPEVILETMAMDISDHDCDRILVGAGCDCPAH